MVRIVVLKGRVFGVRELGVILGLYKYLEGSGVAKQVDIGYLNGSSLLTRTKDV
jgi:hypothetical protein